MVYKEIFFCKNFFFFFYFSIYLFFLLIIVGKDSASQDEDILNIRAEDEKIGDNTNDVAVKKKKMVVEDEFNIEPLKPTEKVEELLGKENKKSEEKKAGENAVGARHSQVSFY